IGLVAAVELVKDKATKESFDPAGAVGIYLSKQAQKHGLIIRALGDNIAFSPPLIITGEEIDEMLARFAKALDDTEAWVCKEGLAEVA
ncbi:MAG: aspartate aminotransferase family protein, partial [Alphaproteobacteria bacterium]